MSGSFDARPKIPWGPIGEIVYTRTYARFIPELGRREYWWETVDRVVQFSASLAPGEVEREELEDFRRLMLGLKAFPAGRTLWIGGSTHSFEFPQANFNCAFLDLREARDFHDLTYLLMSGVGVGYRVTEDNVRALQENLPLVQFPRLVLEPYNFVGKASQLEETAFRVEDRKLFIWVGDSRDGWAALPAIYLRALSGEFGPLDEIRINFDYVRPLGWRLKRFGGYASGPQVLMNFLEEAHKVLQSDPKGWTQVKAMDLADLLGRTVVAGGTRRSALIALGDSEEFAKAKTGDWWAHAPWRVQSNNSLILEEKPDVDEIERLLDYAYQYGEPGFVNAKAAGMRRPNFRGVNPCAEILLDSFGFCNLTTLNLSWMESKEEIEKALRVLTRHALRITLLDMPPALDRWDRVQKRDRLLGVSMTGIVDAVDKWGWSLKDLEEFFSWARKIVHREAKAYADQLGVNPPLLSTTIKPEGTISQLPGVSSGIHPSFAPFYIRRIRINAVDALAQALRVAGYEPKPEYDPTDPDRPLEDSPVWVFEFPVRSPARRSAREWKALEMAELYKTAMRHWADHNVSITIEFSPEEKGELARWLHQNWDDYVAISFFPRNETPYPLMPYEAIDEATYWEMVRKMPDEDFRPYLDAYESAHGYTSDDELEDPSCATGACPVR